MIDFANSKKIRYWRQGDAEVDHNFGDLLSEIIAKEIVLDAREEACSYRVIGSCIADWLIRDDLRDCVGPAGRIAFWGCGMRDEAPLDAELQARCLFKGVRGPLTRDLLGLPEDTVLGDLGLLVPLTHAPSTSRRTLGRFICVPHINDQRSDRDLLSTSMADVLVRPNLDASESALRRMIDDIASASFVLCGALHAAIVAHAYGVPFAFWESGFVDLPFKWRDFASSIGIMSPFAESVDGGLSAYDLLVKPHQQPIPLSPILAASPFHVQPSVISAAVAYDASRSTKVDAETSGRSSRPLIVRSRSNGTAEARASGTLVEMVDTMIGKKLAELREPSTTARSLEALSELTKEAASSSQASQAEFGRNIATLATAIDRSLSELRLASAFADAQSHMAALQASLKEETEVHRRLQSQMATVEANLVSEAAGRRRAEAAQLELETKLAAELDRVELAGADRLALKVQNDMLDSQIVQARGSLEQAETDLASARETSRLAETALIRERTLMESESDLLKAETRQAREHVAALERQTDIGRLAEARANELRGQMQTLTRQRQTDIHRQARLLDDSARRIYIVNHRADTLMELAAARLRMRSTPFALRGAETAASPKALTRREIAFARKRLATNGMFAPEWYRQQDADAAKFDDAGALKHFLTKGIAAGRDPHPLVSMAYVARQVDPKGKAPLLALLDKGSEIDPHPLFDTRFYLDVNPDVSDYDGTPFEHFIVWGATEGRKPHAAFDPAWYLRQLPAEWARPDNALIHYLTNSAGYHLDPHPLFDAKRYLRDLAPPRPVNPLLHFITLGEREGRVPHPLFEPSYYLRRNADIAAAGTSPFLHFLRFGAAEHRVTHPLFDPVAYTQANRAFVDAVANPLLHYVVAGARQDLPSGSQILTPAVLAEAVPDIDRASTNPLVAFLDGEGLSLKVTAPSPEQTSLDGERTGDEDYGPEPVESFSLPQRLREYVDERFGLPASAALRDLMAVVHRYGDRPHSFTISASYEQLLHRLQGAAGDAVVEPDVSIIIPIHNALVYTLTCVVAILESDIRHSFEIIIGDDASTDATAVTFGKGFGRISVVRHDENLGFLANCNATAAAARGRHVLLLNNDTLALPEWLDTLVELADGDPTIGFVGSKLLNPDGSLQEAGGIVWDDGSAWNFGRGEDPNASAFNYVRDVDYCSGASILVPRHVWNELDGFDRIFMPAYCEDSDFAFRAREAGYRTVYQPFSEIVHHEGRSHGRDENKGIKQYQAINANKLFARWRNTLARENLPNGESVLFARDRSRGQPHMLVVDHYVPQWDRDAGSRTMYNFLRAFVDRGVKIIFWPDNLYQDPTYTRPLQELGIEVLYGPSYVGQFERWFSKNAGEIPYVLLSRPHISTKFIDIVRRTSSATIFYYGHDLHSRRLLDEYKVNKKEEVALLAREFGELELRLWQMSDVIMYPSESERAIVDDMLGGGKVVLAIPAWTFVPRDIDAAVETKPGERLSHMLLFVGGFTHGPNVDGILWFTSEVMPLLRAHDPGFTLTVVGSNAPSSVLALAGDGIRILGFVDDDALADLYAEAGVAIAPLRFGGGVKGKVIEAFSKAIPVVTTPVGVQGIEDAQALAFVAESAADFAAAVIAAAEDHHDAETRVAAAAAFVGREYTAEKLMDQLTPFMPELGHRAGA